MQRLQRQNGELTCSRWHSLIPAAFLPGLPAAATTSHSPPGPRSWSVYLAGDTREPGLINKETGSSRGPAWPPGPPDTHQKESWCPRWRGSEVHRSRWNIRLLSGEETAKAKPRLTNNMITVFFNIPFAMFKIIKLILTFNRFEDRQVSFLGF